MTREEAIERLKAHFQDDISCETTFPMEDLKIRVWKNESESEELAPISRSILSGLDEAGLDTTIENIQERVDRVKAEDGWLKLTEGGGLPTGRPDPGLYLVVVDEGVDEVHRVTIELRFDRMTGWMVPETNERYFNPVIRFIRCKRIGD